MHARTQHTTHAIQVHTALIALYTDTAARRTMARRRNAAAEEEEQGIVDLTLLSTPETPDCGPFPQRPRRRAAITPLVDWPSSSSSSEEEWREDEEDDVGRRRLAAAAAAAVPVRRRRRRLRRPAESEWEWGGRGVDEPSGVDS